MNRGLRGKILAVLLALFAGGTAAPAREWLVYFATYTGVQSQGIYVSRLDDRTGKLTPPELAAETPSPCYLAVSPDEKFIYSADSVAMFDGEKAGSVSAFAINPSSGLLKLLNRKSSGGSGPCHVSVDATGRVLLAANYGAGSVKSFRLNPDGSIGSEGSYIRHQGAGANPNRQAAAHAHFICADPSNHFALACDLGADKVVVYKLNGADARLVESSFAPAPPGAGPRHLAFSPDGQFARAANELGCSVTTFAWNSATGTLVPVETVSALPPDAKLDPAFTAAEIVTAGHYVYVSLRGHDSVSVFRAHARSGRLALVQNLPARGNVPRGLGVDPAGRWLIVCNQKSGNVVEFAIDPETGKLSPTGQELKLSQPVDVKFIHRQ